MFKVTHLKKQDTARQNQFEYKVSSWTKGKESKIMIFQNSRFVENITDAQNLCNILTQAQTVILRCQKETKKRKKHNTNQSLFLTKTQKNRNRHICVLSHNF